jgi:protein-S-isoprenylcysteine O-methyltransferase Ste14
MDITPSRWNRPLQAYAALIGLTWLAGPFLAAGTFRWPGIWIYMATIALGTLVQRRYLARVDPGLLARRRIVGAGTKGWDVAWMLLAGPLTVLPPLVAGLGVRAGWSTLPLPFAVLGIAMNAVGGVLFARAMANNPHFESTVRIQDGHSVVDSGLYRIVRHPGYTGFLIGSLGAPLMLMSRPAMLVAPLLGMWFVVRTALEDATLRKELPGYADYARRVKFRLVPRVW